MKISKIHVHHANRSIWGHLAEREKTLPLVTPLDIYTDFKETRGSWFWDSGMAVIQIETDDGLIGTGWCEDGCEAVGCPEPGRIDRLLFRSGGGLQLTALAWAQENRFEDALGVPAPALEVFVDPEEALV